METLSQRAKQLLTIAAVLVLLSLVGTSRALAQGSQEATSIRIGAPAKLELGQRATIQVVLVDSAGKPIAKARVLFISPLTFLNRSGDVVVAQTITNKEGQAIIEYETRSAGAITLSAEFRGDERYAPSNATVQINVTGSEQLYVEHVAVHIPGLNTPPFINPMISVSPGSGEAFYIAALWPAMTGCPIAAMLIVVWSLYIFVAVLIFRVAAASDRQNSASPASEVEV